MENNMNEIVLTSVGTLLAYMASKNYFIPWIIKGWEWIINKKNDLDKKQLDVVDEIQLHELSIMFEQKEEKALLGYIAGRRKSFFKNVRQTVADFPVR